MSVIPLGSADRLQVLSICPVFARLPAEHLGVLAEMLQTERLGPGEVLFEHGDPADRVYLVAGGSLGVFLPGRAGPVRSLGPGQLLGEYGMFSGGARTATVKAGSEASLLSLDYRRFRAFLLRFPESALALLQTAAERLLEAEAAAASGGG